jgi:hypothetical protein
MGMFVCRSFRTRDTTAVALSRRRSGARPLHSVAERGGATSSLNLLKRDALS